jgi:hypothetical protein
MSSFWNRRAKAKKKLFIIDKIAYSFLYIFSISIFYLLWDAYIRQDVWIIGIYAAFYLLFLIPFFLVVRDIHNNYGDFEQGGIAEGTALLEGIHFLCADPMCPRCGGWYIGLGLSFAITIVFKDYMVSILRNYSYSQYYVIVLGVILFLLSTPIHGSLTFLKKFRQKTFENKRLKMILGLVSGLSLTLIVTGILMLTQ